MENLNCTICECFKCPRLDIPHTNRGFCDSCNNCINLKPLINKSIGERCMWRAEYEGNSHEKYNFDIRR